MKGLLLNEAAGSSKQQVNERSGAGGDAVDWGRK